MTQNCLIPIADGTEEIEAVCMIDTLRRAQIDVTVASVHSKLDIVASRGVKLTADTLLAQCEGQTFDMIALPGGLPGSNHLADCDLLITMLNQQKDAGRWYAAICAAPAVVFQAHGLLEGRKATCYPSLLDQLTDSSRERVVVDRPCITGQGPGAALDFSLALVEALAGPQERQAVAEAMLVL